MADIDELSSDSDDEEYIPEGGGFSSGESDGSEGEPEEAIAVLGRRRSQRNSKDADQLATSTRKRQRRPQRSTRQKDSSPVDVGGEAGESGEACEGGEAGGDGEACEGGEAGGEASQEEKEKSRIDDLWASFKRDTELKTPSTISSSSKSTAAAPGTTVGAAGQGKGITGTGMSKSAPSEKTVKVKQKYDFAGEEVEVEKEVAADSEEAKAFLRSQQQQQQRQSQKTQPISLTSSAPSAVVSRSGGPPKASGGGVGAAALLTKGGLAGSKRSSGLSSVLQSIGKKPKLSTLEKSSLDWNKYKEEEGLEEELAQHSKDGYLDKQEFLQRADVRQFELEREERLKRFRRMY